MKKIFGGVGRSDKHHGLSDGGGGGGGGGGHGAVGNGGQSMMGGGGLVSGSDNTPPVKREPMTVGRHVVVPEEVVPHTVFS